METEGVKTEGIKTLHTTGDYGLIAFLAVIKHIRPLMGRERKIHRGKMEYVFSMTEEYWVAMRTEYSHSIFPRFLEEIKLRRDPSY